MKKFVVQYRYWVGVMEEESYGVTLVNAETPEQARTEAGNVTYDGEIAVDSVTECADTDWVVDLCEGNETVATFDVPGLYPVEGVPDGDVYLALFGEAKANAERIIREKYPEFFAKLNEVRKHRCEYYLQKPEDSMVIVRPKKWVHEGKKAYLVTVFYRHDEKVTHFSVEIRARDSMEASRVGVDSVMRCYASGEFVSVLVMRTAEPPSLS